MNIQRREGEQRDQSDAGMRIRLRQMHRALRDYGRASGRSVAGD